jgi:hypothetical protein
MRTGVIDPWSRLTKYSSKNQLLMYIKRCKKVPPLHLHIRLLSGFKKRRESRSIKVCNLICRSLFCYYSDYSTICFPSLCMLPFYMLPFYMLSSPLEIREGRGGRGRRRGGERKKKGKREEEEGGGGEEEGERRVLASPLKQNLAILALVVYKILETSPCN